MWRAVQEASEEYLGAKNTVIARQEKKVSSFCVQVNPYLLLDLIEKSFGAWYSTTYPLHDCDGFVNIVFVYAP